MGEFCNENRIDIGRRQSYNSVEIFYNYYLGVTQHQFSAVGYNRPSKRFSLLQYLIPLVFSYRRFFSTFPATSSSEIQTQLLKCHSFIFAAFSTQRRRIICLVYWATSLPPLTPLTILMAQQLQESLLQGRTLLFLGCG